MKYPPGGPLTKPELIIVHHSATKDSHTLSWQAIRDFHTRDMGWDDIAYHAGIEFVRGAYEVIIGRPENRTGGHTKGKNSRSLGFLFVGDYDIATPSDEMLQAAARRWFVPTLERYGLTADDVRPHRDFADKTCPGAKFNMNRLIDAIEQAQKEV